MRRSSSDATTSLVGVLAFKEAKRDTAWTSESEHLKQNGTRAVLSLRCGLAVDIEHFPFVSYRRVFRFQVPRQGDSVVCALLSNIFLEPASNPLEKINSRRNKIA